MAKEINHLAHYGESICPYCGVGCRLWAEEAYGQILRVKGAPEAPANLGSLCAKGATLPQVLATPDRLVQPQVRASRKESFRPVSWDQALQFASRRFLEIIAKYGPDAVAFYGSGQLDSESVYCAVKLFKGRLGTNNTDSNSRLCMATAAASYVSTLGSDGPPTCYEDIEHADCYFLIGSNMAEAHPVTFDRMKNVRRKNPGRPLIVVDPRCTKSAKEATLHIPVAPGGDIALLNAIGRRLLLAGRVDENFVSQHANGFEGYAEFLRGQNEVDLLAAAGVSQDQLDEAVAILAKSERWLSFYCMGVGQSAEGTAKIQALIDLHLMTGNIGREGAGPFSLTGQPNAMGGREGGLLAHQLPGYRFVNNTDHRREVEEYWGLTPGGISPRPGLTAVEMFRALETGKLKAIWIAATNPMVSLPDLHQVRRALERAELVIVQDPYHPTETTQFADVLFPAANWFEKEWTSTNSERMVSISERLVPPPGNAKPDWEIIASFARTLKAPGFDFADRAAVWDEFRQLTQGRPCDLSGITAARLVEAKNLQWPCPSPEHPGTKRRYLDQVFPTADGRANFQICSHRGPHEPIDHEFPFVMTSGRIYAQWHTMTRTGKSPKLMARDSSPYVEIHPDDAAKVGVQEGGKLRISSRRGAIEVPARITADIRPGVVFVPFHWGDLWGNETAPNYLTVSALDPKAKQPEFKYCAVALDVLPTPMAARTIEAEPRRGWQRWLHEITLTVH